jgi:hypothetical protein
MLQPIVEKSYLVELNLGTVVGAQRQVNFQFIPQLKDAIIYGVEVFSATQVSLSPNGATVVSTLGLADLTVTFAVGDDQDVFLQPCADLNPALVAGFIRMYNNKRFNLTKSFITMQGVANIAANQAVLFNFFYRSK